MKAKGQRERIQTLFQRFNSRTISIDDYLEAFKASNWTINYSVLIYFAYYVVCVIILL